MRMPWGKYKGRTLDKIPRGYLRWALATWELNPWQTLKEAMSKAVEKNYDLEVLNEEWPSYVGPEEMVHDIVKALTEEVSLT